MYKCGLPDNRPMFDSETCLQWSPYAYRQAPAVEIGGGWKLRYTVGDSTHLPELLCNLQVGVVRVWSCFKAAQKYVMCDNFLDCDP